MQCYNKHVQVVNNNEDLLCWSQLEHLYKDIPLDSACGEDFRGCGWPETPIKYKVVPIPNWRKQDWVLNFVELFTL